MRLPAIFIDSFISLSGGHLSSVLATVTGSHSCWLLSGAICLQQQI